LRDAAERAAGRMPSIRRVLLFGSLAAGIPTPRSDADLLVLVDSSRHGEPRDRIPEVLAALEPLPCPVDLFVVTEEEAARADDSPLLRVALVSGIDLFRR
jgi:predicted nucleotidyltransferase